MMNDKIEKILFTYGVFVYNDKINLKNEIIKCSNDLMNSYDENQVYIFSPVLKPSADFYYIMSKQNKQKLKGMWEKGLSVSGTMESIFIRKHVGKVKCIIDACLNPPVYRFAKKIILQVVNRCKVVNIQDYLKAKGYELSAAGYRDLSLVYDDVYADYERYQRSRGTEEERVNIKRLIGDYLEIKDFVNAEKWIAHLSELYGEQDADTVKYQKLWGEMQDCLKVLAEGINGKEHIVVNWVDALRYDELSNMEYLSERVHSGIDFEKMYAPTPYTSAALKALMTGKYIIDDKAFLMTDEDYRAGKLYQYLQAHGYCFKCSSSVFYTGIFSNEDSSILLSTYMNRDMVPSTVVQFDAICNLYDSKEKCFYIIHNICETHEPCLNPLKPTKHMKGINFATEAKAFKKQIVESQKYLDEQLRFYGQFYEDIKCNIYMSDHGKMREEEHICIEGNHHIIFSVFQKGVTGRSIQAMASQNSFPELVKKILEDKLYELEKMYDKDYVLIEMDDLYSGKHLNEIKSTGLLFMQYRGVITRDDSFVKLITGQEFYFRNGGSENLGHEERYQERIDCLRTLAGNKYIDIHKERRYQIAIDLYQYMGWKVAEDIEYIE